MASTLPCRIAATPSTPRSWAARASGIAGITSTQSRTRRKNEALTTSADSTALAAGGAPAWAGGSHMCSGNSAALASRPTLISTSAAHTAGPGRISRASSGMSRVPWAP